jgi:hypothetical protein
MADDYLWDRTGPVDPEVAALEARLAPLRMPEPLRAPVQPPLGPRVRLRRSASPWGTIGVAALSAAATAVLIWAWIRGTTPAETPSPSTVTIDVSGQDPGPVSVGTPPVIAAPQVIASPPPALPSPPAAQPLPPRSPSATPRPSAKKRPAERAAAPTPTPPPSTPELRESLTASEVRNGIEPIKEKAKACGASHGALPGEKVVVKITIAGATGRVTYAGALHRHRGTPLGQCVADAFHEATFPKFAKTSIGVQYPVRM